ncbi:unnamed protein product [Symbiodinium natans]|uniref:Uncharacterized protein n=1 Tax=Symbiodinium natans TaxID=878477 RepID=A0A812R8E2_9DINO|nr:unnamed protein product [Symbiodinium natans]
MVPLYWGGHHLLGGSRHRWPQTALKDWGDKRRYLSFWGGARHQGCCHEAYDDTATWYRDFSFHYCAPKCIDKLNGEDYCSKWCNHKGKWGCGVQSDGQYTCDCTGCSGCKTTTTTTTQGVLLGFSGPYRINTGGDVDGFTYFRSKKVSEDFLTDEKVGDKCDAWAVLGGVNGGTHPGGIRYYYTHVGWPKQVVHFEFHFCDFVSIKRLRIGTPNYCERAEWRVFTHTADLPRPRAPFQGMYKTKDRFWPWF